MGNPTRPVLYRTGLTGADVLAATGTVTCTKINGVGAMTAGTHFIAVVAGNAYGRGVKKAGNVSVVTETTNLTVKAAFAAVPGATFYDIYGSVDADPKWIGRITEAQRASGILLATVGTPTAGGAVDSVYCQIPGTGLQSATTAAVATAYVVPAPTGFANGFVCRGYDRVYFDCLFSRTGDAVAPACVVTPFLDNLLDGTWYAGTPVDLDFGGTAAKYKSFKQRLEVDTRGARAVHLLVQSIAGTGAAMNVYASKAA